MVAKDIVIEYWPNGRLTVRYRGSELPSDEDYVRFELNWKSLNDWIDRGRPLLDILKRTKKSIELRIMGKSSFVSFENLDSKYYPASFC